MAIVFPVYGLFIFLVFNFLMLRFCLRMGIKSTKQNGVLRFTNIMILIMLVTSYIDVLNTAN
ncbi:hypothetical protein ACFSMW_01740 [Virgibacillus halophilus]|uniref:Uncharacterized protein n=1 Tax=Tigheibacillus halophilus TaxID=361280 RepID=A0ABU5C9J5_9BACI|nr:hypothetical protein [Virgibacillus halophilus]